MLVIYLAYGLANIAAKIHLKFKGYNTDFKPWFYLTHNLIIML